MKATVLLRQRLALTFALVLSLIFIRTVFYIGFPSISIRPEKNTMADESSFLSNLQLRVAGSPDSKHAFSVSVTNTHSSSAVTILKWNSPLDVSALSLGLVEITPPGASKPIHIDAIKIKRLMPPKADSLVTLLPGETASNTINLDNPRVPSSVWEAAGPAKVKMAGRWMAVWPGSTKEELLSDAQALQSVGAGAGSLTGTWESEYVNIGE